MEKAVANSFDKLFQSAPEALDQCEMFAVEHEPRNSDVGDYVADVPLQIPSWDVLFSGSAIGATRLAVAKATTLHMFSARNRIADAVYSVNCSRR